jgi:hypothetical protein
MKSQIAVYREPAAVFRDAGADEGRGGELRRVENVRAFEVGVSSAHTGVN